MLKPIGRKPKKREFIVYDLEWVPGFSEKRARAIGHEPLDLRLIGVYDGKRYRHYTKMRDFLNGELTRENRGKWFYAHAGGLADIRYVLEYLIDSQNPHIKVHAAFSGSAAIIVRIEKGKSHWYLLDSFWLMRQPLRKIGKWLGLDKGGEKDSVDIFYAPLPELIEYNRRDCVILWKAIHQFQDVLLSLGGQLEMTVASSAMSLFRRAFLKRKINTLDEVNAVAREAYIASRVEVFQQEVEHADYYDINSSFPHAMTFEAPGNLRSLLPALPDSGIQLARARVRVKDCYLPPIPYRAPTGRVFFPTGEWDAWFSSVDLHLLEDQGHDIIEVSEVYDFEPFNDLKDYAETIYSMREQSKDEAFKVILKFLLNSLYGKFGENEVKSSFVINPSRKVLALPDYDGPGTFGKSYVLPGVYEIVEQRPPAHAHVPISVHITAIARRSIYDFMRQSERVYYCDTDGFAVPEHVTFDTSEHLGGLKKEKHVFAGRFVAPKLYAYRETEAGEWTIKAKGFSKVRGQFRGEVWTVEEDDESRPLTYEDFCGLLEHREVHLEQFSRVRGGLKQGWVSPRENMQTKAWRGTVKPKRCFEGTHSRPWNVREL